MSTLLDLQKLAKKAKKDPEFVPKLQEACTPDNILFMLDMIVEQDGQIRKNCAKELTFLHRLTGLTTAFSATIKVETKEAAENAAMELISQYQLAQKALHDHAFGP